MDGDALDFLRGDVPQPPATVGAPGFDSQPIAGPTRAGVPVFNSRIQSTFAVRPIGGQDFILQGMGTFVAAADFPAQRGGAFFNFAVPQGYRAILRGYRYELNPWFLNIKPSDIVSRLTVGAPGFDAGGFPGGGSVQIGFANNQAGQVSEWQECYALAEQNDNIALLLTFVSGGTYKTLSNAQTQLYVEFYGNLIVSTGRPLIVEPSL